MWYRNLGKASVLAAGASVLLFSSQVGTSQDNGDDDDEDEEELEFDEASIYFELNDTDGDLGIHGFLDGDAWKRIIIEDPNEQELMNVWIRNKLRRQGLTEFFFESDEPTFDELSPRAFFRRFPEGTYEIEGLTLDGEELEAEIEVSHVMAGPPATVTINGKQAAPNCDSDDLPVVSRPVTVDWSPVTMSHPTIGTPNVPVNVLLYQFVGEIDREGQEPDELSFVVNLPSNVTKFTLPGEFIRLSDGEVKYEIIIKLDNGNQTGVESCFEVE